MNQQVVAFQAVGEIERRVAVVAVGIFLGTLQETLGIDVVVVAPRDDWSYRNGTLEDIVAFEYAKRRQVAAKAPSEDADAVLVNPRLAAKPLGGAYGVDALVVAQIAVGHLFPFRSTSAGATTVEAGYHIAFLRQHAEPVVVAPAITVGYLLVAGTAIDVEE